MRFAVELTDERPGPRVKGDSARVILGFYSSEHVDAEKAFQSIGTSSGGRAHLFHGNGVKPHAGAEAHYSALRLDGESLVVAETPRANVQAIVEQLQSSGLPAVFVLREDLAGAAVAPKQAGGAKSQSKRSIVERLRASKLALDASRRDLLEAARLGHSMTAAAEWLLDNAYLIRTQIAETRRHLPRDHSKLLSGRRAASTCPDVYELAERLVAGTDHALNEANITECLRQYQTAAPLTIAELWLFPLLLRMALFEALASLAAPRQPRATTAGSRLSLGESSGGRHAPRDGRVREDAGAAGDGAVCAGTVLRYVAGGTASG